MSTLIEPEEIIIKTKAGGTEKEYKYMIGKYDGFNGLDLIEYAADILKSGVNPTQTKKGLLRECMQKMGKYIEAVVETEEGVKYVKLDTVKMLETFLPDPETSMKLMRSVHDKNTFFLNSERLLKESLSWMDKLRLSVTKTLTQLQASSSDKKPQRSKS